MGQDIPSASLSRRRLLKTLVYGASAPALLAILAACGGESTATSPAASSSAAPSSGASAAPSSRASAAPSSAGSATTPTAPAAIGSAAPAGSAPAGSPRASATPATTGQAAGTPVQGGTLIYGNAKPVRNIINPLNTVGGVQNEIIEALFLRLAYGRQWGDGVNPQASGPIDLAVAEKMTEVEKDRVWDFTIRPNVKWHDGKPVTADDVIFGIWLSLNKNAKASSETPVVGLKGGAKLQSEGSTTVEIEGAKKINENTVRIELEQPVINYWVNWGVGYWPMPKHILGALPLDKVFDEPYATMPIGNGPFKAVKYVEGQYMEMEANPDFYLGRPHIDKYIVRFGDTDTLTAALEAQEIDGMPLDAGVAFDRLIKLPHIAGNPVMRDHPFGFAANREQLPKQGGALNRAIMHAIDVDTINKQLLSGTLRPSNYLFEHVVGLETPPTGFPKYPYDPEKAKAILKEAGWDASKELRWIMWSKPAALQDAMQAMLAAVGINAKYKVIDVATVVDQLYRGSDWDIVYANFGSDQNMSTNWKQIKGGWNYDTGGFNYSRYNNPEVDALWTTALAETDAAKRKALFDQVSLKLAADPPQGTLWRGATAYAWNKRVKGVFPYQFRKPVRPALERVWLDKR